MTDRLDAMVGRQSKDGKTYWTKIGVAFPTKNGGWSVQLEAMPAPHDGAFRFALFPPRERAERPAADTKRGQPFDDEIPPF